MFNKSSSINGSQIMSLLTVLLTLIASTYGFFIFNKSSFNTTITDGRRNTVVISKDSELFKSLNKIDEYRRETLEIKSTLDSLKFTSTLTSENVRIEELQTKVNTLQEKIDTLNEIIISSPEKSLSLPMMRKDIDAMDKSMKSQSELTEKQFQRFYDLFLWICGTIMLGIVGLGVTLFQSSKSNSK